MRRIVCPLTRAVRPSQSLPSGDDDPEAEALFGGDDGDGEVDGTGDAELDVALEGARDAAELENVQGKSGEEGEFEEMVPPVPPQRYHRPKPLADVKVPTAAEVARHNLTHLPYRRWCIWCVAARRGNVPHRSLPPYSRSIPLLVFDYCFVKKSIR